MRSFPGRVTSFPGRFRSLQVHYFPPTSLQKGTAKSLNEQNLISILVSVWV